MGNQKSRESLPADSPLGCILKHWKYFSHGQLKKNKLICFCNTTWPQYTLADQEKWPVHGTLNFNTLLQLDLFCKREEKWDEIPYVQAFMALYGNKRLQAKCKLTCVALATEEQSKKPPRGSGEPDLLEDPLLNQGPVLAPAIPPPDPTEYLPPSCLPTVSDLAPKTPSIPPSLTPYPEPTASLVLGPNELPSTPMDLCPRNLYPSPEEFRKTTGGVLCVQEAVDGQGGVVQVQVPFSVSDLSICKEKLGNFSENPEKFREEFVKLSLNFTLSWQDVIVILTTCCTSDEKNRILAKARQHADSFSPINPRHDILRLGNEAVPRTDPQWNYQDQLDQERMKYFITCVVEGMQKCIYKPVNYSKIGEVTQGKDENPDAFLSRLTENFKKFTNKDTEAPETALLLGYHFITQSAPDIRRKLQKLKGGPQTPLSELVEEAFKVFNNREKAEEEERDKSLDRRAQLLAAVIQGPCQGNLRRPGPLQVRGQRDRPWSRPSGLPAKLGPQQCAYCKREGHWKRECPCRPQPGRHGHCPNGNPKLQMPQLSKCQGPEDCLVPFEQQQPISVTPAEPEVTFKVAGRKTEFLLDMRAAYSVLNKPIGKLSSHDCVITGVSGQPQAKRFTFPLSCEVDTRTLSHSCLSIPEHPVPLLCSDLLTKIGGAVLLSGDQVTVEMDKSQGARLPALLETGNSAQKVPDIPQHILKEVNPLVWDVNKPGRANSADPVRVELKPGVALPWRKQHPLKPKAIAGIKPVLKKLLRQGLIEPCQSPCNTPILPVRKPNGEYSFMQNLRAVNEAVVTIPALVPNPYTLLTQVPATATYFTVLHLKDAFFCVPLHPDSQELFAFEWEDPDTRERTQFKWTVLPQGFKNSSHLFCSVLAKDLRDLKLEEGILLQYIDDLLIASKDQNSSDKNAIKALNHLANRGYRVSRVQITQKKVKYLGFQLSSGIRQLLPERILAITSFPAPTTRKQLRRFLGMAEFCRIWIPNFGLIARPLYESLKGKESQHLEWTQECEKAFETIKLELHRASALGLPDLTKPFRLCVHERERQALGVLTQQIGPLTRPVAYYSKQLDPVARGWPACLRAVAATVILIKEASKFTLGQPMEVLTPHQVQTVLEVKGGNWLSGRRITQYQAILLNSPEVTLKVCQALNPDTLLPATTSEDNELTHNCIETIDQVYSSRSGSERQSLRKYR
ncbi:uncharacterized protein LOC126086793 [Elephas maximus indicus]|uniref:uncharacterized protein LOC126086793 n=1 Tax=Elephas maximus indicus TaxID=99487 RepID=UPI00211715E5|nr:uncharacterized protein LOC126086793 [Elephas maximus indicus]